MSNCLFSIDTLSQYSTFSTITIGDNTDRKIVNHGNNCICEKCFYLHKWLDIILNSKLKLVEQSQKWEVAYFLKKIRNRRIKFKIFLISLVNLITYKFIKFCSKSTPMYSWKVQQVDRFAEDVYDNKELTVISECFMCTFLHCSGNKRVVNGCYNTRCVSFGYSIRSKNLLHRDYRIYKIDLIVLLITAASSRL